MFIDIFFLLIFLISLLIIVFIILKRFPQIKSINTDLITKEIEDKQKRGLLEQRLDRKIKNVFIKNHHESIILNIVNSIENKIKQNKILEEIDKFSRNKKDNQENIKKLLDSADENIKKNNFIDAENICFALLKKERDNINILDKLASVYIYKNNLQRARETYEYIITILKRNRKKEFEKERIQKISKYKTKIAEFYFNEKNYKKSLDILNELIINDENNPKILDLLIECNINLKNKFVAEKLLNKLSEINPENYKIQEFKDKIVNIFKK